MANYKIIGADLMEYGPASAEQIRQWIAEGRVDSESKLQAEGGGEWTRLADVPEFAAALPDTAPPACPKCGEPFAKGFDSCWKCGAGKDGSPPKQARPLEVDVKGAAVEFGERCPKCGSRNVRGGKLLPVGRGMSVMFKPEGTRFFILSFTGGVELFSSSSSACLDCGLVWAELPRAQLKEFISKHCREPEQ
jgi:predicted nucleic-acid-binding Zn-ribbon protein